MNDVILDHLSFSYPDKPVFHDFSARFEGEKTTCIFGHSGCGKTTLFRLILGLEKPDAGSIIAPSPAAAQFQNDRLLSGLSALRNLQVAAPEIPEAELRGILHRLLLSEEEAEKPVFSLSGGMRRRVSLARAIAVRRPLTLLDEPFTGLDAATKRAAAETVRELLAGKTVLAVSHSAEDADLLGADRFSLSGIGNRLTK